MRDEPGPGRSRPSGEKMIRIDPCSVDEPQLRGRIQDLGLLDRFRTLFAAPTRESRRATRHAARTPIVWLGWWRNDEAFFAETARLTNISRGGALISLRHPPPESYPVWICLGTPEPDECLAAHSLEVRRARRGECTVRLSFREPCPSRFLEAAVCGRTSDRPRIHRSGA